MNANSIRTALAAGLLAGLVFAAPAAEAFKITVKDAQGRPAENVVVALYADHAAAGGKDQDVRQQNKLFDPFVTVVPRGTTVRFPNHDSVQHHVYSFSKAKTFDLPLFHGDSKPVVFDKPGVVSVGCNIHDWMLAYIVVVDTPWFARTGQTGTADVDLPPGHYTVKYWYPGLKGAQDVVAAPCAADAAHGAYELTLPGTVQSRPPASLTTGGNGPYGGNY
jgi:plastocyanin